MNFFFYFFLDERERMNVKKNTVALGVHLSINKQMKHDAAVFIVQVLMEFNEWFFLHNLL